MVKKIGGEVFFLNYWRKEYELRLFFENFVLVFFDMIKTISVLKIVERMLVVLNKSLVTLVERFSKKCFIINRFYDIENNIV